jgi:hypothetical protein
VGDLLGTNPQEDDEVRGVGERVAMAASEPLVTAARSTVGHGGRADFSVSIVEPLA